MCKGYVEMYHKCHVNDDGRHYKVFLKKDGGIDKYCYEIIYYKDKISKGVLLVVKNVLEDCIRFIDNHIKYNRKKELV